VGFKLREQDPPLQTALKRLDGLYRAPCKIANFDLARVTRLSVNQDDAGAALFLGAAKPRPLKA
jgi:hypothetical protein